MTQAIAEKRTYYNFPMAWTWDQAQKKSFVDVKVTVSSAPVFKYYDLNKEVTVQCDAYQSELSAALLQDSQPVACASCALASVETHYAQIEKELLAIVLACEHFFI